MKRLIKAIGKLYSRFIINAGDSEIVKARKVSWYMFFGSILMIVFVSWLCFILFTFSQNRVKIPHIEGEQIYNALKKLSDKGLVVSVNPKYSEEYAEGIVFEQSLLQGSLVKKGRRISVSVSLGTASTALPDFNGFTLFELADFLDKQYANIKIPYEITTPVYEYNESMEKGRIIKQEPKEGTPLKDVKSVKIWVSNGIEENVNLLPDFTGKKLDEVSALLISYELYYTVLFTITDVSEDDFTVKEQSLGEGYSIQDIVKQEKPLILSVDKFVPEAEDNDIEGIFAYSLPKKPLPYDFSVRITDDESIERPLLSLKTKGGTTLSIPYVAAEFSKIQVYIDNQKIKEEEIIKKEEDEN